MKIVTWNTAGRNKHFPSQFKALVSHQPDLIALQEIRLSTYDRWLAQLEKEGYAAVSTTHYYNAALPKSRHNFVLIASRAAMIPTLQATVTWPEKVLSVRIPEYDHLRITTAHIPPGSSNGWVKIETFEGLYQHLAFDDQTPEIFCGDFNAPQTELSDGTLITWGQKIRHNGSIGLSRCKKQGSRWHDGEYSVLKGLESYGFSDNYRVLHGYAVPDYSWYVGHGTGKGRRFDHIFSKNLHIIDCYYDHSVRETKLSDHSMMISSWKHL